MAVRAEEVGETPRGMWSWRIRGDHEGKHTQRQKCLNLDNLTRPISLEWKAQVGKR